jgi:predicted TIM-barrel fold metal-dependent hydrolase
MIEAAEALGIEKLCCSRPITGGVLAEIEDVRDVNDSVLAAMKRYPDRIAGFCFIQPGNGAAALDDIERCLDAGMIGVKLYNQYRYSDPIVFPVAERCIARGIPILGHSGHLTDARELASQPKTSDSLDFCALSQRYPELMLILGHINGGGDWEWAIKGLRGCSNVYLDTSGSVVENDTIEMSVRELGHKRLLFATDQTMEGGVGKILAAELTPSQREDIFWRNFQKILDRRAS